VACRRRGKLDCYHTIREREDPGPMRGRVLPEVRTSGEDIPLKRPRRRSSRMMAASAWKVERYWMFRDGFWNLYFTFCGSGSCHFRVGKHVVMMARQSLRKQGKKLEAGRGGTLPSPVSNGKPTMRPETPAAVPAKKSSVGSSLSVKVTISCSRRPAIDGVRFPLPGETESDIKEGGAVSLSCLSTSGPCHARFTWLLPQFFRSFPSLHWLRSSFFAFNAAYDVDDAMNTSSEDTDHLARQPGCVTAMTTH